MARLKIDIPITEEKGLFVSSYVGEFENNGWKGTITTTGKRLVLVFTKDDKRITQSVSMNDLLSDWVEQVTNG